MALRLLGCSLLCAVSAFAQSQPSTGSISGVVVDALGEPIVLAEVSVSRLDAPARALLTTRTDGRGTFVLAGEPLRGAMLRVQARSKGRTMDSVNSMLRSDAPSAFVQLRLWDAGSIRGRIVDPDAKPIAGATVCAQYDHARGLPLFDNGLETTTDAEGRFTLDAVPLGWIGVRAWAPGHCLNGAYARLAGSSAETKITLPRGDGVTLTLRVTGLEAEARAQVGLYPYVDGGLKILPSPLVKGTTAADGTWIVKGLPDWEFVGHGAATGHAFEFIHAPTKPGTPDPTITLRCAREGSVVVHGSLRDAHDKPLAGETLVCRERNGMKEAHTVTRADGTFEVTAPLVPGANAICRLVASAYVLAQEKEERFPGMIEVRTLADHEFVVAAEPRLDLRAEPASGVQGRVLDKSGKPVSGARVELQESNHKRTPRWLTMRSCTSDLRGCFEFMGVRAPPCELRVAFGQLDASASPPFELVAGRTIENVILVKQPDAIVEGAATDVKGAPIPGARVLLRPCDLATGQNSHGTVHELLSNREGRYRRTGVEPGGYRLELFVGATDRGCAFRSEPFEITPGQRVVYDLVTR